MYNLSAGYLNTYPYELKSITINYPKSGKETNQIIWDEKDEIFKFGSSNKDFPKIIHKFLPIMNFEILMEENNIDNYILVNEEGYVLINKIKNDMPTIFMINNEFIIKQIEIKKDDVKNFIFEENDTMLFSFPLKLNTNLDQIHTIEYLRRTPFIKNLYFYTNDIYLKVFLENLFLIEDTGVQIRLNANLINKMMFVGKLRETIDLLFTEINNTKIENLSQSELKKFKGNEKFVNEIVKNIKGSYKSANFLNILNNLMNNIKNEEIIIFFENEIKLNYLLNTIADKLKLIDQNVNISMFVNYYFFFYKSLNKTRIKLKYLQNNFELFSRSKELEKNINETTIKKLNLEIKKDLKYYYPTLVFEFSFYKFLIDKIGQFEINLENNQNIFINFPKIIIGIYFFSRLIYNYKPLPINTKQQIKNMFDIFKLEEYNKNFYSHFKSIREDELINKQINELNNQNVGEIYDLSNQANLDIKELNNNKKQLINERNNFYDLDKEFKKKFPKVDPRQRNFVMNQFLNTLDKATRDKLLNYETNLIKIDEEINKKNKIIKQFDLSKYEKFFKWMIIYIEKIIYFPKSGGNLKGYYKLEQKSFKYGLSFIPDCGETTLLNLINLLIWENKSEKPNITYLPPKTLNQLIKFYEKYKTLKELDSSHAHNNFSSVVSFIPKVKYASGGGQVEIVPEFDNILKILSYLFNIEITSQNIVKDFDTIIKSFRSPNQFKYDIIKEKNANTLFFLEFCYKFIFTSRHGSTEIDKNCGEGKVNLFEDFFEYKPIQNYLVEIKKIYNVDSSLIRFFSTKLKISSVNNIFLKTLVENKGYINHIDPNNFNFIFVSQLYLISESLSKHILESTYLADDNIFHILFLKDQEHINEIVNFYIQVTKKSPELFDQVKTNLLTANRDGIIPLDYILIFNTFDTFNYIVSSFKINDIVELYNKRFENNEILLFIINHSKNEQNLYKLIEKKFVSSENIKSAEYLLSGLWTVDPRINFSLENKSKIYSEIINNKLSSIDKFLNFLNIVEKNYEEKESINKMIKDLEQTKKLIASHKFSQYGGNQSKKYKLIIYCK